MLDPKYIPLFLGGFILWMVFIVGVGTLFGLLVLCCPAFADWVKLTFGGPAIPSTVIALLAGVVTSLSTPRSTFSESERLAAVRSFLAVIGQ